MRSGGDLPTAVGRFLAVLATRTALAGDRLSVLLERVLRAVVPRKRLKRTEMDILTLMQETHLASRHELRREECEERQTHIVRVVEDILSDEIRPA